jgi:DNA repair ATPase RecN
MATATDLHMVRLEVENFLRVTALAVDAEGKHVIIRGQNGAGKTSALDAIWAALSGRKAGDLSEPIQKGAHKASVTLDLGEYVVERRWTEGGMQLIVRGADGIRLNKPQQILDGLLGKYSLDPVAFLGRTTGEQVDDILALAGVEPPVEQVREITGESQATLPGESAQAYLMRLSADHTGIYYAHRREAHRQIGLSKGALEEQKRLVDKLPEGDERSATDLLEELRMASVLAERRRLAQATSDEAGRRAAEGQRQLASLKDDVERLTKQMKDLSEEIDRLQKKRAVMLAETKELSTRVANGEVVVTTLREEEATAAASLEAAADPNKRIESLTKALSEIEQHNEVVVQRKVQRGRLADLRTDVATAETVYKKYDTILTKLRELRRGLLNGVDLGAGLEIGEGELRLHGVSFRQASAAERMEVACMVAFKQAPRLKLLRCDNIEHMDSETRKRLFERAAAHGWQVVAAAVAENDGLRVEIVDG